MMSPWALQSIGMENPCENFHIIQYKISTNKMRRDVCIPIDNNWNRSPTNNPDILGVYLEVSEIFRKRRDI